MNSPAYLTSKLLDIQALVSGRKLTSVLVTLTMNPWREEMGRLRLDIENRSTFNPRGSRRRVLDSFDLTARVYTNLSKFLMREMKSNIEKYFGRKCASFF